jgi:hypothetical protein
MPNAVRCVPCQELSERNGGDRSGSLGTPRRTYPGRRFAFNENLKRPSSNLP